MRASVQLRSSGTIPRLPKPSPSNHPRPQVRRGGVCPATGNQTSARAKSGHQKVEPKAPTCGWSALRCLRLEASQEAPWLGGSQARGNRARRRSQVPKTVRPRSPPLRPNGGLERRRRRAKTILSRETREDLAKQTNRTDASACASMAPRGRVTCRVAAQKTWARVRRGLSWQEPP